jgi:hypothetical protein
MPLPAEAPFMKMVLLLVVLPLVLLRVAGVTRAISARRRIAHERADAALARARAARRQVPAVSNNLKGVTASQTISPFVINRNRPEGGDERAR